MSLENIASRSTDANSGLWFQRHPTLTPRSEWATSLKLLSLVEVPSSLMSPDGPWFTRAPTLIFGQVAKRATHGLNNEDVHEASEKEEV